MKYYRYLMAALVLLSILSLAAARPMTAYAAPVSASDAAEGSGSQDDDSAAEESAIDETSSTEADEAAAEDSAKEFIPRLEAPSYYNDYYFSRANLYYASGYGMPNCTAYAYGRAYEILESEPRLSIRDAGCWWYDNIEMHAYDYGQEPRLGAVACWDNYDESTGHVSVVEEIREDGSVLLSESSWSGYLFDTFEIDAEGNCKYTSSMRFLGYIYTDKPLAGDGTQIITSPGSAFQRSQLSKSLITEEPADPAVSPDLTTES
ncbi:MAG: CHAP domain-containing protein [Firmicutes bacterium]|nr:CHAP domain-containing protein [Bacillota bacterium]